MGRVLLDVLLPLWSGNVFSPAFVEELSVSTCSRMIFYLCLDSSETCEWNTSTGGPSGPGDGVLVEYRKRANSIGDQNTLERVDLQ